MRLKAKSKTPVREKIYPKKMLQEKRSYCDKLHDDLTDKGVDFFVPQESGGSLDIDTNYLTLPRNITEVPARDLGEYLNAFTQQKMYMRTLLGWQECMCEEAYREYLHNSQDLYKSLPPKMSEKSKERELSTDEEISEYYDVYSEMKRKCMLLEMNIASIEDAIFLISREVSRRNGDFENERRDYNVGRM